MFKFSVEPQRRLAPHLHTALRGAIPRQIVKAVTKGTYLHPFFGRPSRTQSTSTSAAAESG
jgi:hypothetical protein